MKRSCFGIIAAMAAVTASVRLADAAEICGNGVDDDSDGYADEGCFSNWVMGQCPSALSCKVGGDVSPVTGAYVYQLEPDIAPAVPYGGKLQFRRTYMSMYSPAATNYRTTMGAHWQHNWQSWLDKSGTSAIVHLPTGQEVNFTYSNTTGGYDYYTAQVGYHVKHLRQATTAPNNWELRALTGETLVYNWTSPVGKLIEVRDSLATPNKITIAYLTTGSNKGQIDTVTDASGKKRLKFTYTSGLVTSVAYQTVSGGTGTTRVTLSIAYTGTNPTTVQLGGSTIQSNAYVSNNLTSITDAGNKTLVELSYSTTTAGKVVSVMTGSGGVGYDYASSNSQCIGGTALFFNTTGVACSSDANCSGFRCGGKTGAGGNDGKCYRAARCLNTTSPSEDLVTTMTAFTPCTGACAPTSQYSWNTSTLDLKGVKLADNNWTSYQRNSDGLPTLTAEGDSDDDPTNAGGAKTWLFYSNSSFPGRVTERRTQSLIKTDASCSASVSTPCKRSQFTWNADGLLATQEEDGWQYGTGNLPVAFANTTTYAYDSQGKGRIASIDGPLSGSNDVLTYTYWTSTDVLKDGYLNLFQRKKDSTSYLTTTLDDYDYFGNAKSSQDPDGSFTCRSWDVNRNYVSQVREAMAGQTSCATTNAADIVTGFLRDSALRLTKTTRPIGDCQHREYDTYGRLEYVKLRDDCTATNAGNTVRKYYSANGFNEKNEFQDAASTVTRRSIEADFDATQVSGWTNPVSPAYSGAFTYFADAQLASITGENNVGKTEFVRDEQNRETTQKRYYPTGLHDDWTFGYPTTTDPTGSRQVMSVTDPASKVVTTNYDDLGRKNRIVSPDSGTTIYTYDEASRLATMVEAVGSFNWIHNYTYDNLGRKLTEDYSDSLESCSPGNHVTEVTYVYDSVACPTGATCSRQNGRLAYAKTKLLCSSTYADHTLDQETFYAYDDAGRVVQEFIQDDTGRTAAQGYAWDKNGNLKEVAAPSGAAMTYTIGGTGNSDANLITTVARTVGGSPTNLVTGVNWAPFGPVTQYDQANTIGGSASRATLTYNVAYRTTQIKYAAGPNKQTTIDYSEDEKGRYTQKLYSNVDSVVQNNYLTYDWLDRLTCDNTVSGSCPTSGTAVRTNISYNNSNDRSVFYHYNPSYSPSAQQYTESYFGGTDTINTITYSTGSQTVYSSDFTGRGLRGDDHDPAGSFDRRDYTYDDRRRVRTISGQYQNFGLFRNYVITYAYDHRDRLVFRSFKDQTTLDEAQSFYYYDNTNRLIEVKNVPQVSNPGIYSVYDFYWIGSRPIAQWTTNFPGASTARYFMHADEADRVVEMYDWPTSGDSVLRWSIDPDMFGWERPGLTGPYQPLRLGGRLIDDGTYSWFSFVGYERPPLLMLGGAAYDPMTETELQRTGTWPNEPYAPQSHNPWARTCLSSRFKALIGSIEIVPACACAKFERYGHVPVRTTAPLQPTDSMGDGVPSGPIVGVGPLNDFPVTAIYVIVECGQKCDGNACADTGCEVISPYVAPGTKYPGTPPGAPLHLGSPCGLGGCGGGCNDPQLCGNPT